MVGSVSEATITTPQQPQQTLPALEHKTSRGELTVCDEQRPQFLPLRQSQREKNK
jgi:hypothetical protein